MSPPPPAYDTLSSELPAAAALLVNACIASAVAKAVSPVLSNAFAAARAAASTVFCSRVLLRNVWPTSSASAAHRMSTAMPTATSTITAPRWRSGPVNVLGDTAPSAVLLVADREFGLLLDLDSLRNVLAMIVQRVLQARAVGHGRRLFR